MEKVVIGDCTLYLGDCLDLLKEMEPGSVDAIVTDPPYGIKFSRATWEDDVDKYEDFIKEFVSECQRIVVDGWCFVFQAMLNCSRYHEWFPEGWRIFAACKNFAQIRPGIWHSWDPVVFWRNGKSGPSNSHINRDYHIGTVVGVFGRDNVKHPCPRPLDTMKYIVQIAAPEGGVVVDPFLGSGTTALACLRTGRKFVGCEISPDYFNDACKRIRAEYERHPLFENAELR